MRKAPPAPAPTPAAGWRARRAKSSSRSSGLDEAVQHLLRPGLFKLYVQLVPIDRQHASVAKLLVEDALADAEIGLVALDGPTVVEGFVAPARVRPPHGG